MNACFSVCLSGCLSGFLCWVLMVVVGAGGGCALPACLPACLPVWVGRRGLFRLILMALAALCLLTCLPIYRYVSLSACLITDSVGLPVC
ncbi:uncharacterized protein K452DRAFT_170872 [Aplosporella prunicola CBS 121167]|uniref:Uncharacterized protein n=1 Tax=Aplosporella prunicola CBS 121167 TaxID=1176127 RepID=A0A6A6BJC5_9PEZI|nr:uncharacterized protein K452DRAFT_170872 [Aplosporella prunicola CBS 121167]KAF2143425.1 hypothetical protein K452DRAFT_170872 [Aplosporella prunicola CBS 121167]